VPQLMPTGLPDRASRARSDFSDWADGQAWKFKRGEDYKSSTDSFRYNVNRWAKANGYAAETRPIPATDERGRPIPATKAEPVGLAVRFTPRAADDGNRGRPVELRARDGSARAA
jgi:hypothetical protein